MSKIKKSNIGNEGYKPKHIDEKHEVQGGHQPERGNLDRKDPPKKTTPPSDKKKD